jgi:hypothetical protein
MLRVFFVFLRVLCVLVAIWVLFFPQPYWISITVGLLLPPLTLVFAKLTQTDFTIQEPERKTFSSRLNLAGPFVILAAALFLRALFDFNFPDKSSLLTWLAMAAPAVGLALWVVAPGANLAITLLIGLAYAYPFLAAVNSLGEQVPSRLIEAKFARKYINSKPYFRVVVASAEGAEHTFVVDKGTYELLSGTEPLCVAEHTGMLGLREFNLSACAR